jgi:thiamine pyrophosphate-dependent acetolactate synthase large subunit-like protein
MATTVKLFRKLAGALAQAGIGPLFGVTGDANVYMADSYVRDHGGRFVAAANENGAVLMALGHASVTGKVAVATVTHGPALTNTVTALAEGVKAGTPIVLICGDTTVGDRENLQNIAQREVVLSSGAGFEQMNRPETAVQDLARAFRRAAAERRPVAFNFPAEMMHLMVKDDLPAAMFTGPAAGAHPAAEADIEEAVAIIAAARRPIVLAGRDAIAPLQRDALLRLAARIEAPLATTLRAKGLFRGEPYDLGIMGTLSTQKAADVIARSDCVLAFGAGLNFHTTGHGGYVDGRRVVQVAATPAGLGRGHAPDVGLAGDMAATAERILYWLDEAGIAPSGFRAELGAHGATDLPSSSDNSIGLDYIEVLSRLDALLPADRLLVTDAGRHMVKAMQYLQVEDPRLYVQTASFGSIGLGIAQAVGAAAAEPGRPVVVTTGDGGFMLGGLTEFNTAVRHGMDLIVLLFNDGCYGAEYAQLRDKQMDTTISMFDWPDFAPLATALGGRGVVVRSIDDLEAARTAIANRDRPLLIEVKLDPHHVPFW